MVSPYGIPVTLPDGGVFAAAVLLWLCLSSMVVSCASMVLPGVSRGFHGACIVMYAVL